MRLFGQLASAINVLLRLVGLATPSKTAVAQPVAQTFGSSEGRIAVHGPAVAGFVMRACFDRFFLASRLASVAKLNTPAGRKPRIDRRLAANVSPVPAARLGARKTRMNANQGPRVLRSAQAAARPTGKVILFPTKAARALDQTVVFSAAA